MEAGVVFICLFAIACGTGLIGGFFWMCVEMVKARALKGGEPIAAELGAIREEIRCLREQNADLILHYDTAVQQLGAASVPRLPVGDSGRKESP